MIQPQIIFEDLEILVINKPWGITVNNSDTTHGEFTVQDFVTQYLPPIEKDDSDFYARGGIVHRLDKETSGVLIIAKTKRAFEELQRQFKERIVKKKYIALAHGTIEPEEAEIRVPVGRLPWNRKRFGIVAEGRDAITKYKVIKIYYQKEGKNKEPLSLVELYPETGRTHQIRVHLQYIHHPIVSDFLYAGRKTARDDRKLLPRVFLHAQYLSLQHPVTHTSLEFQAELPLELQTYLDSLSLQ